MCVWGVCVRVQVCVHVCVCDNDDMMVVVVPATVRLVCWLLCVGRRRRRSW